MCPSGNDGFLCWLLSTFEVEMYHHIAKTECVLRLRAFKSMIISILHRLCLHTVMWASSPSDIYPCEGRHFLCVAKWNSLKHILLVQVMPEDYRNGRRPILPLWNKKVTIVVGEPMQFDIPALKQMAPDWARALLSHPGLNKASDSSSDGKPPAFGSGGASYAPHPLPFGIRRCSTLLQVADDLDNARSSGRLDAPGPTLDEAAWRWMYTHISDHIWVALNNLTHKARTIGSLWADIKVFFWRVVNRQIG